MDRLYSVAQELEALTQALDSLTFVASRASENVSHLAQAKTMPGHESIMDVRCGCGEGLPIRRLTVEDGELLVTVEACPHIRFYELSYGWTD